MQAEIFMDGHVIGTLSHNSASGLFSFNYSPSWKADVKAHPLSPSLPLIASDETPEKHSAQVRQFFENLLPEGQALDNAASIYQVSKSNVMGLLLSLGKETAGAISIRALGSADTISNSTLRPISHEELSERINNRDKQPFAVWDGKIRLSIAGFQDKIAVFKKDDGLFLTDGPQYASTRILKPEPVNVNLQSLTSNEFFCMRLAERMHLPTSKTELIHVPEPVLLVTRFDRIEQTSRVKRVHVIDGCQALGLSSQFKYERPYGDAPDVRNVRTGASLPILFKLIDSTSATPAAQKMQLLRWVIFQVLIGNTDAHGKNLSFFYSSKGLELAPSYDLTCSLAFNNEFLDDTLAMAIGDAFKFADITAFEWAYFADQCEINKRLVAKILKDMSVTISKEISAVMKACIDDGADKVHLQAISEVVLSESARQLVIADMIVNVPDSMLR